MLTSTAGLRCCRSLGSTRQEDVLGTGYLTTTLRLRAAARADVWIEPKTGQRALVPTWPGWSPRMARFRARKVMADYVRLNQSAPPNVTPVAALRSMKVGARTMWAKATGKNLVGMGRALTPPGSGCSARWRQAGRTHRLHRSFRRNGVVSGIRPRFPRAVR